MIVILVQLDESFVEVVVVIVGSCGDIGCRYKFVAAVIVVVLICL